MKRLLIRTALEGREEVEKLRIVKQVLWESCMSAAIQVGGDVGRGFEKIEASVGDILEGEM